MAGADETLTVDARMIDNISKVMKGVTVSTIRGLQKMQVAARGLTTSLKNIGGSMLSLKGLILGAGMVKVFKATVGAAGKFEAQMQSVSTLSEEMSNNIGKFSKEVLELSTISGQSLDTLTKSLFDSISAGVAAGEAMEFLTVATKLAIGGSTETAVAVDGLTTIINAYGLEASEAIDVSDAFFEAMKFGKTTIQELATAIGPLAPTAKAANVGFMELLGSVSALTKAGFPTREAITSIQGALTGINTISPEASQKMNDLGLNFKITGEEGATFADVVNNINEAAGGTLQGMLALIPNIRGAKGILGLAAEEGKNFAQVMQNMTNKVGATETAYSKFTQTFEFKSARVKQSFNAAFIEIGNQILPFMKDFMDSILANMDGIKAGMAFTAAVIADAWNGIVFVAKLAGNAIISAVSIILGGLSNFVSTVAKIANKLPGTLIPEEWVESLDFFTNVAMGAGVDSFKAMGTAAEDLGNKGSNIIQFFGDSSIAIQANATSVKDLTEAEREALGMGQQLAEQKKALSEADLAAQEKLKEDKLAFMETIRQLEVDNLMRSHEGRLEVLAEQREELLGAAWAFELDEEAIKKEFDAREIDEINAHFTKVKATQQQASKDKDRLHRDTLRREQREREARIETSQVYGSTATSVIHAIGRIAGAMGANAKVIKRIAFGEAVIQGALAIQKAIASAPFPLNIPAVISTTAQAAANVATIASQAFVSGGLPKGRNANILVNEQGQESVINARGTGALGIGGVNALNSGQVPSTSIVNQISYNPTINVEGGNVTEGIINALSQDKQEFARFFQEEIAGKGYFDEE